MIDFSDHRVIAIMVSLGIAFVAVIAILCRFFVRRIERKHNKKKWQTNWTKKTSKGFPRKGILFLNINR